MDKIKRNKMLALIHAQERALAMTKDECANLLLHTVGVDSAAKMDSFSQFSLVIKALNTALREHGLQEMGGSISFVDPMVWSIRTRAMRILGKDADARLAGYVKKIGRDCLEACNQSELRRVQGFLSTISRARSV